MGIKSGFKNLVKKSEDIEKVAAARKAICDGCFVCEYGASRFCKLKHGGCGCYLPAKRRSLEDECPIGKWGSIKPEEIGTK
jgi:hypothetical protein